MRKKNERSRHRCRQRQKHDNNKAAFGSCHSKTIRNFTQSETKAALLIKMKEIAKSMPEWEVVIEMSGVGETLAAQLIAQAGDINRFDSKKSLTGFAGVDSPPKQSGTVDRQGEPVTKSGSPHLRRALFLVMRCLIMTNVFALSTIYLGEMSVNFLKIYIFRSFCHAFLLFSYLGIIT